MKLANKTAYLFLVSAFLCCCSENPPSAKITGVSYVAPRGTIGEKETLPVNTLNASWVCLMPFAYGKRESAELVTNSEWQWWGEKPEGIEHCIKLFRKQGKKIMIKPQLWIIPGDYSGDFNPGGEKSWETWEKAYTAYILNYAKIAHNNNIEIFCIGTELRTSVEQRPAFWAALIDSVRAVYPGKITYAANWDDYKKVPFWEQLDYIGVDAYFPLSDKKLPEEEELMDGWKQPKKEILALAEKYDKQVLFTEIGYRSMQYGANEPWDSGRKEAADDEFQQRAYSAMFRTFWDEDLFAGVFVWKWFHNHEEVVGERHATGYTPQNKPAEATIRKWFGTDSR